MTPSAALPLNQVWFSYTDADGADCNLRMDLILHSRVVKTGGPAPNTCTIVWGPVNGQLRESVIKGDDLKTFVSKYEPLLEAASNVAIEGIGNANGETTGKPKTKTAGG